MSLRVHSYAKCSTCRDALAFLAERGVEADVLAIREQPPTVEELRAMLRHQGGNLRRLFNTSGLEYKAQNFRERLPQMSEDQALALLSGNGMLVKRPFALSDRGGVVGFKREAWEQLLNDSGASNPKPPTAGKAAGRERARRD